MSQYDNDYLTALRMNADRERRKLFNAVESLCPGPHEVVQHRDGQRPWCHACKRTFDGVTI